MKGHYFFANVDTGELKFVVDDFEISLMARNPLGWKEITQEEYFRLKNQQTNSDGKEKEK